MEDDACESIQVYLVLLLRLLQTVQGVLLGLFADWFLVARWDDLVGLGWEPV